MKIKAEYENFEKLDIRVGKIIKVEDAICKKPCYKMTIDFSGEIGLKISIGAFKSYEKDYLLNKSVICIVNLGTIKMGNEISEVFTLGVDSEDGKISFLTTDRNVSSGSIY